MNITIVKFTRSANREISALVSAYEKRLRAFATFENLELRTRTKNARSHHLEAIDKGNSGHYLVALDTRGKQLSSEDLAGHLAGWMEKPQIKKLIFAIGDPYGLDEAVLNRADFKWGLSKATLPTDHAWLLCWEQIYRAMTIIHNIPYHHD